MNRTALLSTWTIIVWLTCSTTSAANNDGLPCMSLSMIPPTAATTNLPSTSVDSSIESQILLFFKLFSQTSHCFFVTRGNVSLSQCGFLWYLPLCVVLEKFSERLILQLPNGIFALTKALHKASAKSLEASIISVIICWRTGVFLNFSNPVWWAFVATCWRTWDFLSHSIPLLHAWQSSPRPSVVNVFPLNSWTNPRSFSCLDFFFLWHSQPTFKFSADPTVSLHE